MLLGFGLVLFFILLALGTWQVQRLYWKEGLLQTIEQRTHSAPVPLAE
ncbi:MAG: SURF1 family protein, partial [Mesorhizobium sp.]